MRCREVRLEYGEPDVKGQRSAARSEANACVRIPKIVGSWDRAHSVNKRMVRRTEAERLAERQKRKLRDRLPISSNERKREGQGSRRIANCVLAITDDT